MAYLRKAMLKTLAMKLLGMTRMVCAVKFSKRSAHAKLLEQLGMPIAFSQTGYCPSISWVWTTLSPADRTNGSLISDGRRRTHSVQG